MENPYRSIQMATVALEQFIKDNEKTTRELSRLCIEIEMTSKSISKACEEIRNIGTK